MPAETYEGFSDGWHSLIDNAVVAYGSAPPPPNPTPKFGFNTFSSYNGYSQPNPAENTTQMLTRLLNDFGPFDYCKSFYSSGLPSVFSAGTQGEAHSLMPADHCVIMFNWTAGAIASGSMNSALTTYINSVPAGKTVYMGQNEIDNHIGNNTDTSAWSTYVADMDKLWDLVAAASPAGVVKVTDCFMEFTIEPSTPANRQWKDYMTNPAKRHGIIWDNYWNLATVDKSGNTQVGLITSMMNHLGLTDWIVGELGDRRQEDSWTPSANIGQNGHFASDAARATMMTTRINALLTANPAPKGICWFDLVGTTGDHRIITMDPGAGPDVAMKAALRNFIVDSRS